MEDALAPAFALRHPHIDMAVVTTVCGDTGLRAWISAELLQWPDRAGIEVVADVGQFIRIAEAAICRARTCRSAMPWARASSV
jgi:hypothetical protein